MKSLERISDVELNALVDGELIAERRAQVERWLAEEPEAAARVESWRRQNDIIRAAFVRWCRWWRWCGRRVVAPVAASERSVEARQ